MNAWYLIGAICVLWVFLSAFLIVSLCRMSSRYTQQHGPAERPVVTVGEPREITRPRKVAV